MARETDVKARVEWLTDVLGRKPTLEEVFYRDFTATGKFKVADLGLPPRGEPRGRREFED